MKTRIAILLVPVLLLIYGCTAMPIENYRDQQPRLILEDYFVGQTRAWGMFQDRKGDVQRRFTVDIKGYMENNELVLEEDFVYSDGTTDRRVWRIHKLDEHHYEGRAADVIGTAAGVTYGNALNWAYTLDLPYKDGTVKVQFDDWMFLQPDGVLINRAEMRKFGILLGEVTLVFQRQ